LTLAVPSRASSSTMDEAGAPFVGMGIVVTG
jgi:hypothetical protein